MSTINPGIGRLLAGCGGAVLIASLFMNWADYGETSRSGWEALDVADVFFLITGLCGIVAGVTGGRFGFFRSDLSFDAMTDIFGVASGTLIAWFLIFDFPDGASRGIGAYLALVGAWVVATGAGDFRVRAAFPSVAGSERADPLRRLG
jgi:hypothetical protein